LGWTGSIDRSIECYDCNIKNEGLINAGTAPEELRNYLTDANGKLVDTGGIIVYRTGLSQNHSVNVSVQTDPLLPLAGYSNQEGMLEQ
jgi:hypothetical protein